MALDLTPEQKATGQANFNRALGALASDDERAAAQGLTRRRFMGGLLAAGAVLPLSAAAYFGYQPHMHRVRDNPVRAGIIGTGDEGGVLVGEHNPANVRFVACSDLRPYNQQRIFAGEAYPSPRRGFNHASFRDYYGPRAQDHIVHHENYRDLLADPNIEMVVIALPLHLHARVAIEAMEAGKHVLCEKLMAWNVTQCKEMIRAADRTGKLLSIGHQRHYSMLYAHATEMIDSGVLGDIHHIRALWHRNNTQPLLDAQGRQRVEPQSNLPMIRDGWRPEIRADDRAALEGRIRQLGYRNMNELVRWRLFNRTGGGLMAELGSHQLDACSIFLGKKRPLSVSATGGKYFYRDDREVEDHVFCTFEFPGAHFDESRRQQRNNDIVVVNYSSVSTNAFEQYGECVMGSRGTLIVQEEKNAYLFGGAANANTARSMEVTATTTGGRPALDASASTSPTERQAAETGQASLGAAVPSRGYKEEMDHLALCIRMRNEGMERDRERWQPRCHGRAAMADAIIALTANQAMKHRRRIEFLPSWFDPASNEVPDADMVEERVS